MTMPPAEQELFTVRGFQVVVENSRPDIRTGDVLQRLDDALQLIEQAQPWRLRHLQRDLRYFWIVRYACRGAYFPDDRVCMTELTFLNRRDIMGVRRPGRDRAREERLCRRAELEFGLALGPALGAPVVERALASLQLSDTDVAPVVDWGEAQRRIDEVDRGAQGG